MDIHAVSDGEDNTAIMNLEPAKFHQRQPSNVEEPLWP